MANALAYYDTATITAVKSFIVQALGVAQKHQNICHPMKQKNDLVISMVSRLLAKNHLAEKPFGRQIGQEAIGEMTFGKKTFG